MMQVYQLHVDGKTLYVESTPERLKEAMYAYIKAKRKEGRSLGGIEYCWTPITIRRKLP